MTITALPTPPLRSDPTNFAVRADAFLAALPTFQTEANALAVAMNLNATTDTSATSNAIGLGAKTFTVTAGKSFQPGMFLVFADTAAPSTNSMVAQVTSYSTTSLVVNSVLIKGSGTKTAWTISQSVPYATSIDGIPIGATTTSTGAFTALSASGEIIGTGGMRASTGCYIYLNNAANTASANFQCVGSTLVAGTNTSPNLLVLSSTGLAVTGVVTPEADNTRTLGTGALRWSAVYAGTGTINTSDAREKTAVRPLAASEITAAKQLSKEIGAYQFLSAVAAKGDTAREHIGMTVQRVIEIMQANGLNPFGYGFVCHDAWETVTVKHPAIEAVAAHEAVLDGEGVEIESAVAAVKAVAAWIETVQTAGDRYAFRMDELLMFISRGFEARLTALEMT